MMGPRCTAAPHASAASIPACLTHRLTAPSPPIGRRASAAPPRSQAACRQRPCGLAGCATRRVAAASAHLNGSGGSGGGSDASQSKAARLRQLLADEAIIEAPACFDGLSACLVEEAGFPAAFLSGFSVAAARAGAPDTGLLSYAEVLDSARCAIEGAPRIPIIVDGDTGYGNAMNVKRTVRGFAAAGAAGVLIEDQVWPKSCGHVAGKRVVPRAEAVARVRAAVDARDEGADIVIVARTDARQAVSLDEALARCAAFADAGALSPVSDPAAVASRGSSDSLTGGADVLFIDALASVEEMAALAALPGAAASVPKMANNLEGGGRSPVLPPAELQALGFGIVAYPLSLIGVAAAAMRKALAGLRKGRLPPPEDLPSFQEIQQLFGFPAYFEEEARYAVSEEEEKEDGSGTKRWHVDA